MIDALLADADAVVFLCSGNMVRSAFADLYARHAGCAVRVLSGGTTYRNDRLFPETAHALTACGVDAAAIRSFRPTHIDDLFPLEGRPAIFGMRDHHLDAIERWPELRARATLLGELDPGGGREILDPVLEGANFDATFARVARCVDELLERLARIER